MTELRFHIPVAIDPVACTIRIGRVTWTVARSDDRRTASVESIVQAAADALRDAGEGIAANSPQPEAELVATPAPVLDYAAGRGPATPPFHIAVGLQNIGFTEDEANALLKANEHAFVAAKLKWVQARCGRGDIANPKALMISVMKGART